MPREKEKRKRKKCAALGSRRGKRKGGGGGTTYLSVFGEKEKTRGGARVREKGKLVSFIPEGGEKGKKAPYAQFHPYLRQEKKDGSSVGNEKRGAWSVTKKEEGGGGAALFHL